VSVSQKVTSVAQSMTSKGKRRARSSVGDVLIHVKSSDYINK
jgi:hypothetical protein